MFHQKKEVIMLFFICVLIWLFLSCAKEMTGRNGF